MMGSTTRIGTIAAFFALASCLPANPPSSSAASAAASSSAGPTAKNSVAELAPSASAGEAEAPKAGPAPVVKYTDGFLKPESAVYDADGDRYLVSNINGVGLVKDNNGFISVLSPDGQVTNLKWIEGGKNKVTLDGPKGLVISKGILYAADITVVRMFDLKTGASKGNIAVPGATSLNDIAAAPDGKIYVSDTGKKVGADGKTLEPNGNDAIYVINKGKAKALAKRTELGQPNGLVWTDKGLVAVTNDDSGEVYRLDEKAKRQDVTKVPAGQLDGLLSLGDSLLVTSWASNAIYRGKLGGTFDVAIPDQKSPADIGYDTKRGRLLVPLLMENTVAVYELK
jgi:sugar lactone lactonase YvrE